MYTKEACLSAIKYSWLQKESMRLWMDQTRGNQLEFSGMYHRKRDEKTYNFHSCLQANINNLNFPNKVARLVCKAKTFTIQARFYTFHLTIRPMAKLAG